MRQISPEFRQRLKQTIRRHIDSIQCAMRTKHWRVSNLKVPTSGKMRGLISRTKPFGATAAVLRCDAVSRAMATVAVRRLERPCLGSFDDFGAVATESTIGEAPQAFTTL